MRKYGTEGIQKKARFIWQKIHWEVCRKFGIEISKKWYQYEPETVVENEKSKILWDMNIQTDHVIEAQRPDMVVIDKAKNHCQMIDFAVPYDSRVEQKELGREERYQDLARGLRKIRNMKATVTPVVIGALGAIPKKLKKGLQDLGIETNIVELQKSAIIHTARILRKVLEV